MVKPSNNARQQRAINNAVSDNDRVMKHFTARGVDSTHAGWDTSLPLSLSSSAAAASASAVQHLKSISSLGVAETKSLVTAAGRPAGKMAAADNDR